MVSAPSELYIMFCASIWRRGWIQNSVFCFNFFVLEVLWCRNQMVKTNSFIFWNLKQKSCLLATKTWNWLLSTIFNELVIYVTRVCIIITSTSFVNWLRELRANHTEFFIESWIGYQNLHVTELLTPCLQTNISCRSWPFFVRLTVSSQTETLNYLQVPFQTMHYTEYWKRKPYFWDGPCNSALTSVLVPALARWGQ